MTEKIQEFQKSKSLKAPNLKTETEIWRVGRYKIGIKNYSSKVILKKILQR
jgi:hypothetical protein